MGPITWYPGDIVFTINPEGKLICYSSKAGQGIVTVGVIPTVGGPESEVKSADDNPVSISITPEWQAFSIPIGILFVATTWQELFGIVIGKTKADRSKNDLAAFKESVTAAAGFYGNAVFNNLIADLDEAEKKPE